MIRNMRNMTNFEFPMDWKSLWSLMDYRSMSSLLLSLMFLKSAIRDYLPPQVYTALMSFLTKIFNFQRPNSVIIVEEFDSSGYINDAFDSVRYYLDSKELSSNQVVKLTKQRHSRKLTYTMDINQNYEEIHDGCKVTWTTSKPSSKPSGHGDKKCYELSFHPKYKKKVETSYIPHIMEVASIGRIMPKDMHIFTNRTDNHMWTPVIFKHPSTFDTLAIDPVVKQELKEDLILFTKSKDFYRRVGRAWKRGYLLYGPPGTGKTSLIAAIANLLRFNIYDLELTVVSDNIKLRKLLMSIPDKSVVVVEDIDCSLNVSERKQQNEKKKIVKPSEKKPSSDEEESTTSNTISLSGLLNFVDGLSSSCGGERLIIFTTNHKDKLDQALLRPGRMDKHIHLSYCGIKAFKILMKNYLGTNQHELLGEVEKTLPHAEISPASISEIFMGCAGNVDMGMENVVEEIKKKLKAREVSSTSEEKEEQKPVEEQLEIKGEDSTTEHENEQKTDMVQEMKNRMQPKVTERV